MSDTLTRPKSVEAMVAQTQMVSGFFSKDLSAMTHEMLANPIAGKARSGYDLAYEVILINRLATDALSGKVAAVEGPNGWITAPEDFKDRSKVIAEFEESVKAFVTAANAAEPEALSSEVPTPLGPMKLEQFAGIVPMHIMYHSGQLNYIQTCCGDDKMHWAE